MLTAIRKFDLLRTAQFVDSKITLLETDTFISCHAGEMNVTEFVSIHVTVQSVLLDGHAFEIDLTLTNVPVLHRAFVQHVQMMVCDWCFCNVPPELQKDNT